MWVLTAGLVLAGVGEDMSRPDKICPGPEQELILSYPLCD